MRLIKAVALLLVLIAIGTLTVVHGRTSQRTPSAQPPSQLIPSMVGADMFGFYCAPCHGRDGRGNGPVAPALKVAPSDLTRLAVRNSGVFPRARVEMFVTNGAPDVPAHGSRDMPVWGPIFLSLEPSDKTVKVRIGNIVDYVQSIQAP